MLSYYTATPLGADDALRPLTVTLSAIAAKRGFAAVQGLADPLVINDATGWLPATRLLDGTALPALLDAARERWNAAPHAAAALAWKAYSYWVTLPAIIGWAAARRVPLMDADRVLVRFDSGQPLLHIGLSSLQLAVLPDDPLAHSGRPDITVVPDEDVLLKTLRMSLRDHHLDPLIDRIHDEVKVGRRTLLGSVASGISYGLIRAGHVLPASTSASIASVLQAMDLSDLVELSPGANDEPNVQRRTCCLAFTLPEPKVCSGCCLRSR